MDSRTSRRLWLGGGALTVGAGIALFRTMPSFFWKQLQEDFTRIPAPPPLTPNPADWPDKGLHAAWLGHSTVLLKIDGFTVLTDPVFHKWIGVDLKFATVGMKRLVAAALPIEKLPKVDLILSSHAHMDHLDLKTMRDLESPQTEVVMARSTSDLIRAGNYARVQEVGWGEVVKAGPASIRGLQVNHWGARMRTDTYRGYNGYSLTVGRWKILFAGDTADTDAFRVQRQGDVDLAIFPIGAYDPWIHAHCNPEQAWRMSNEFGAEHILSVHHQTFRLSREGKTEPMERILNAAGNSEKRIVAREIGSEFSVS
ncbi:MAG: MBL fold metallo-hydrolase [Acidobacteria bacterium]|nr:MBL fold metallo-hydrolase [Acidobacteriota bacterium]